MLPYEFKAWFEGFSENMKGPPTKDQWAKIQKKVKEISNHPSWYWTYSPSYPMISTTTWKDARQTTGGTYQTLYNSGQQDFQVS